MLRAPATLPGPLLMGPLLLGPLLTGPLLEGAPLEEAPLERGLPGPADSERMDGWDVLPLPVELSVADAELTVFVLGHD